MTETIDDTQTFTINLTQPVAPAKGQVHELTYPADAKNGKDVTITAKVLNSGGIKGDFSLKLLMGGSVMITRHVGWIAPFTFGVVESMNVTMPSSGASANFSIQCIRIT